MASPDITPYIQLPLVDRDPQDIFNTGIVSLRSNLPGWIPREGNIEVLLLEAFAEELAESIFAINRLPDAMTEILLRLYGVDRDTGQPPTVQIKFTINTSEGAVVPLGTSVTLDMSSQGLEDVSFTTDEELVIPAGQTEGIITATGDRFTDDANGVAANTLLTVNDSLSFVEYAYTNTIVGEGSEPEEDYDYYARGIQRLSRLSTTLVLPFHFESAALEQDYISRAFVVDNFDAEAPGTPGEQLGYVSVFVYGENEFVSTVDKALLLATLQDQSHAGLVIRVADPNITPVNVTVSVVLESDAEISTTVQEIENALDEFLDPMIWDWDSKVRRNDIIHLVTDVPGVAFVSELTTPAADIILSGSANLVTKGTVSVNVVTE